MRALDAELLRLPPVDVLWSGPITDLGLLSSDNSCSEYLQKKRARIERIAPLILKRDQLTTSFDKAQQGMSEIEKNPYVLQAAIGAVIVNIDVRAAKIEKMEVRKESFVDVIFEQHREIDQPDRKRYKHADSSGSSDLLLVSESNKKPKTFFARCAVKWHRSIGFMLLRAYDVLAGVRLFPA